MARVDLTTRDFRPVCMRCVMRVMVREGRVLLCAVCDAYYCSRRACFAVGVMFCAGFGEIVVSAKLFLGLPSVCKANGEETT